MLDLEHFVLILLLMQISKSKTIEMAAGKMPMTYKRRMICREKCSEPQRNGMSCLRMFGLMMVIFSDRYSHCQEFSGRDLIFPLKDVPSAAGVRGGYGNPLVRGATNFIPDCYVADEPSAAIIFCNKPGKSPCPWKLRL